MWLLRDQSKGMLILSVLVKVGGSTEGKEGHGFLETSVVVHPLLGVGVSSNWEVIKVPNIQP